MSLGNRWKRKVYGNVKVKINGAELHENYVKKLKFIKIHIKNSL